MNATIINALVKGLGKKSVILTAALIVSGFFVANAGIVKAGPTDYFFTQDLGGEAGLVSGEGKGTSVRLYIPGSSNIDDDAKLRIPATGTLGNLTTFSFWTKVTGTDGELHPYGSMNIDSDGNLETTEWVIVQWEVEGYPPTGVDTWVQTVWDDTTGIHVVNANTGQELSGFGQTEATAGTATLGALKLLPDWTNYNVLQAKVAVGMWAITYPLEGFVDDVNINGVVYDFEPPVTTKTYGEPNEAALVDVASASCQQNQLLVNGHFITTSTTITLNSGVAGTFYTVLVPGSCQNGVAVEWVGLEDNNIYEDQLICEAGGEGGQACVQTWWNFKQELVGSPESNPLYPSLSYQVPFTIPQESLHKICFFSKDNAGNQEEIQCQVALVDDNPPQIQSVTVNPHIIDIENYQGGQNNYFNDPKCATFEIAASDTHQIQVEVDQTEVLLAMFANISEMPSFNQTAWDGYLEEYGRQTAYQNNGGYQSEFCAGEYIDNLSNWGVGVIDWQDLLSFISEKLVLGEFEFDIIVTDAAGKEATAAVPLIITDLTVPLEQGWNLRSTPITLEGNEFWPSETIDAVLEWDSQSQTWALVTDNSIEPLDALYIHATDRNQIGYIFERDLTSPPVRELDSDWNLAGLALTLSDYLNGSYTELYDNGYTCVGSGALNPIVFDSNGNQALEVVISPSQYLDYSNNDGSWYFQQNSWVWIPDIVGNGQINNSCEQSVQNFGGYWLFMENPDSLPGFTTTPLVLSGD